MYLTLRRHTERVTSCLPAKLSRGFGSDTTALTMYSNKLKDGTLEFNEVQAKVISKLDRLGQRILQHEAAVQAFEAARVVEGLSVASDRIENDSVQPSAVAVDANDPKRRTPRGMYLWGGVGTGKSLCMDLFFTSIDLPAHRKRRVHFHNFMLDVHAQIRSFKLGQHPTQTTPLGSDTAVNHNGNGQEASSREAQGTKNGSSLSQDETGPAGTGSSSSSSPSSSFIVPASRGKLDLRSEADALFQVAQAMASEYKLLCFDEFQVTDVADALIMNKLFSTMLSGGTIVVATSNRPVEDLYAGLLSGWVVGWLVGVGW